MLSYVYVGDLFAGTGDPEAAEEAYRLAVQIHAAPIALNRAADSAEARGDLAEARSLLQHSLQLDPGQEEARSRIDSAGQEATSPLLPTR